MKTYFTLFLIFFFSSIFGQTWNSYNGDKKMSLVKNGASIILKLETDDKSVITIKGTCSVFKDKECDEDEVCYKCSCDLEDYYLILKIEKSDKNARVYFYNSLDTYLRALYFGRPK